MIRARRVATWCVASIWASLSIAICASFAGPVAAAPVPGPIVHLDTDAADVGQLVQVTGSGWSPVGQIVQIELCGQDAQDLSSDCDQTNQYSAAIRSGGVFYGALRVQLPATPCPCVVAVADQFGTAVEVTAPISIAGAPLVAVNPPAAPKAPVLLSAKLLAPLSITGWFAGPRAVTLELRITNTSPVAYDSAALSVNVGKGSAPTGFVAGRSLAPLAVGATQVLRIPVTLPAPTAGRYTVTARVTTSQGAVAAVARTTSFPWGIAAIALLIVQAILLLVRNRVRRRLARKAESRTVSVVDLRTPKEEPPTEEAKPQGVKPERVNAEEPTTEERADQGVTTDEVVVVDLRTPAPPVSEGGPPASP